INQSSVETTLAGSGFPGFSDGLGVNAQFNSAYDLTVDSGGNLYLADTKNHRIRKITPDGMVSTLAGSTRGFVDGGGNGAQFSSPAGIAVDCSGALFVGDIGNNRIRKIR